MYIIGPMVMAMVKHSVYTGPLPHIGLEGKGSYLGAVPTAYLGHDPDGTLPCTPSMGSLFYLRVKV